MANTHFVVQMQGGLGTLTLKVYTRGTSTLINTGGDTATENGTRAGWYDWTVTEDVTGIQDCVVSNASGLILASLQTPIHSADDTGTYVIEELASNRLSSGSGTGQISLSAGVTQANVMQLNGDSTAASNARSFFDGTGYAGTNNVIPTVTTLTNLPAITANWLTATGIAADAITAAKIATGAIDADAIADNAIDAGAIAAGAITAAKFAAGAIDAAALAADAGTEIGAAVLSALGTGTWATAIPWNAAWDAEVQSECDDALVAQNLDHLVKSAVDTDFPTTVHLNSVIGYLADNGTTATYDRTTDSLEAVGTDTDAIISEMSKVPKSDSNVTWNSSAASQIYNKVQEVVEANNLDHLVKSAVDTDFATTVHLNSVVGHLADNGTAATYDRTTDSQEAIRDRGDAAWATATGFSTHSAADVWAAGTRTLTAGTNIQLPSNALANVTAWTVNITGTLSGNVGGIATGGITTASFATGAIDAAALASDAANEIADAVLSRNVSNTETTAAEHTLCTLVLAGMESSISGTTWTIKRTNGTTTHYTKTVSKTVGDDPIRGVS